MATDKRRWDDARWYTIDGVTYPSVTTILRIIDKSGPLMGWAVNQERAAMKLALEDALTDGALVGVDAIYDAVMKKLTGAKAATKMMEEAANIGLAAHGWIRWRTLRMLGETDEPEPKIPPASETAVIAWMQWAREVDYVPVVAERRVHCPACGFAGTLDVIAKILGVATLADWKTGKGVYPEAFLQNLAYRHAAAREGIVTEAGLIVRLPKLDTDPAFEAVPVPEMAYGYFISALRLWTWQRIMDDLPHGPAMTKCGVTL